MKLEKNITNLLLVLLLILVLSNCQNKKQSNDWDYDKIDSNIKKDVSYKRLDTQSEILSFFEKGDSTRKRTSGVSYFSAENINLKDTTYSTYYNCRAYFDKSDTLSINIGIQSGFGGYGFIIRYKHNKFNTKAYLWSDGDIGQKNKPIHKLVYQKLILDKISYTIGDSLFGEIDFKSFETDKEGRITQHYGKGNFRTKVLER
jgi:hypothetical protein